MKKSILLTVLITGLVLIGSWHFHKSRRLQLLGEIVPRVETADSLVALTFDDGPVPGYTDSILSLLEGAGVPATFFLIGAAAAEHEDDVRRIIAQGHEVGNHSFSHERMVLKRPQFIAQEIERTDSALRAAGWEGPIHFRAPYGKKLVGLPFYLWKTDRANIMWDVEPDSYREIAGDPERIRAFVEDRVRPGSIILLHPWGRANGAARAALPRLIAGLESKGYRFVTVSELLGRRAAD